METNFIDGITVLSTETTKGDNYYSLIAIIAICCVAFVIGLVISLALFKIDDDKDIIIRTIICAVVSIISGVVLFFMCGDGSKYAEEKTYYKVVIEDTVSWNDVNELYNVEDVDGDIITLTLKED